MKSVFRSRSDLAYKGRLVSWTGTIALVTALSMLYVWHQVETRVLMREILQLEHQKETLKQESAYLHVRIVRRAEQIRHDPTAMDRFELSHAAIGQVVNMNAVDTAMALVHTEPDVRAIAGKPADDALVLASFPTAQVNTR